MKLKAFAIVAAVVGLGSLLLAGIGAPLTLQADGQVEILVQETITVTDSPQVLPPVVIEVTETISVSDSPQVLPPAVILVSETIGVSDSLQVLPPVVILVSETIGVTDLVGMPTDILDGDANGDGIIDVLDMTRVARIILELDPPVPAADANQDGVINVIDMSKIARIILGLD